MAYLMEFPIQNDDQFQRMCWNLRIDQHTCWSGIASGPHASMMLKRIKVIPSQRRNSALENIASIVYTDFDPADIGDWLPY